MKIVYCIHSVYNPGGMERVLLNKVRWLVNHGHQVSVVTTDQKGRPAFYPFPKQVRFTDFGINYSDDNTLSTLKKVTGFMRRRRRHRRMLSEYLYNERPDLTISLYPCESSFIPSIKDGSRKILEFHYSKNFRLQYGRSGLMGMLDKWRTRADESLMKRFDRFVVLTNEDAADWNGAENIAVIPNAAMRLAESTADCKSKRVIAVGRLDYQKGFDRLIEAWKMIKQSGRCDSWRLDIFGQGEWEESLNSLIAGYGLEDSIKINKPVKNIAAEYCNSSLLVMSSNHEGFPMVMIEAMGMGLPVVSFDFKCGPRDIINDGRNGLIVPNGDIDRLAESMMKVMENDSLRCHMGREAIKVVETYSEAAVMKMWTNLFEEVLN